MKVTLLFKAIYLLTYPHMTRKSLLFHLLGEALPTLFKCSGYAGTSFGSVRNYVANKDQKGTLKIAKIFVAVLIFDHTSISEKLKTRKI